MALTQLQNFFKTKIKVVTTAIQGNIYVDTRPTATNGWLVISPGSETLREIVRYTGTGTDSTGDFIIIANLAGRGVGGTIAQAHAIGEPVRMNYTAQHQQEIDDTIIAIIAAGAPNASTTVTGLSRLSAAPVNAAIPIAVGTTDTRMNEGAGVTATQAQFIAATTGMISMYAAAAAPTGFLLCDGAAVSRTTFAALFAITSTTYGVGDSSTTFNVPDLRSSFPVGRGQKTKTFTFIDANVTVATDVITVPTNQYLYSGQEVALTTSGVLPAGLSATNYFIIRVTATTIKLATSRADADDDVAVNITAAAGGGTHTLTLTLTNRVLGTDGGEESHTLQTEELASHIHTGVAATSNPDVTFGSLTNQYDASPGNTNPTGGDTPHNIMPPFVVINYIIKT